MNEWLFVAKYKGSHPTLTDRISVLKDVTLHVKLSKRERMPGLSIHYICCLTDKSDDSSELFSDPLLEMKDKITTVKVVEKKRLGLQTVTKHKAIKFVFKAYKDKHGNEIPEHVEEFEFLEPITEEEFERIADAINRTFASDLAKSRGVLTDMTLTLQEQIEQLEQKFQSLRTMLQTELFINREELESTITEKINNVKELKAEVERKYKAGAIEEKEAQEYRDKLTELENGFQDLLEELKSKSEKMKDALQKLIIKGEKLRTEIEEFSRAFGMKLSDISTNTETFVNMSNEELEKEIEEASKLKEELVPFGIHQNKISSLIQQIKEYQSEILALKEEETKTLTPQQMEKLEEEIKIFNEKIGALRDFSYKIDELYKMLSKRIRQYEQHLDERERIELQVRRIKEKIDSYQDKYSEINRQISDLRRTGNKEEGEKIIIEINDVIYSLNSALNDVIEIKERYAETCKAINVDIDEIRASLQNLIGKYEQLKTIAAQSAVGIVTPDIRKKRWALPKLTFGGQKGSVNQYILQTKDNQSYWLPANLIVSSTLINSPSEIPTICAHTLLIDMPALQLVNIIANSETELRIWKQDIIKDGGKVLDEGRREVLITHPHNPNAAFALWVTSRNGFEQTLQNLPRNWGTGELFANALRNSMNEFSIINNRDIDENYWRINFRKIMCGMAVNGGTGKAVLLGIPLLLPEYIDDRKLFRYILWSDRIAPQNIYWDLYLLAGAVMFHPAFKNVILDLTTEQNKDLAMDFLPQIALSQIISMRTLGGENGITPSLREIVRMLNSMKGYSAGGGAVALLNFGGYNASKLEQSPQDWNDDIVELARQLIFNSLSWLDLSGGTTVSDTGVDYEFQKGGGKIVEIHVTIVLNYDGREIATLTEAKNTIEGELQRIFGCPVKLFTNYIPGFLNFIYTRVFLKPSTIINYLLRRLTRNPGDKQRMSQYILQTIREWQRIPRDKFINLPKLLKIWEALEKRLNIEERMDESEVLKLIEEDE